MSAENDTSEMRRAAALAKLRAGAIAAREKASEDIEHMRNRQPPNDANDADASVVELSKRIHETAKKFGITMIPGTDWKAVG